MLDIKCEKIMLLVGATFSFYSDISRVKAYPQSFSSYHAEYVFLCTLAFYRLDPD